MASPAHPRFNHVAMTVAPELLGAEGRSELLGFYGDVFGWTEMPGMTKDRELLVFRAWSNEQFVFVQASDDPMRVAGQEHFGVSVATREELDGMYARAQQWRERDPRVELWERRTDDYRVLQLHSFYVRFRLPLVTEVQHYEWAPGFDAQRLG